MNPFEISDKVRTKDNARTGGVVKYIACFGATAAGGRKCDKRICVHMIRDYCWVKWGDGTVFSYEHNELGFEQPVIGAPVQVVENDQKAVIDGEALALIEKQIAKKETLNYSIYNGFTQVRYGRDGQPYLVDVSGTIQAEAPEIKEEELDYDVYNGKKLGNVRKSNG
jgi:hypothetical protein